ncbi:MAG: acyl-protein synthetase [Myxococcota bacterium]
MSERESLRDAIGAFIEDADGPDSPGQRDALLRRLATYQRHTIPAYARLAAARGIEAPALPTDVFRFARIAGHAPDEDQRVFRTSGTTNGRRGAHPFSDLALYDQAAQRAAEAMLFPDVPNGMRLVLLLPSEDEAPDSSLSYMCARFIEWFASSHAYCWPPTQASLEGALSLDEPIALIGTSFAFVHAEDALSKRFELPEGSRLMFTGGFKGKSRTVEPAAMRRMLSERFGIAEPYLSGEYGMTELSSQMYEHPLRHALTGEGSAERRYWTPHWVRTTVVDPTTLQPLPDGELGILRIDDLANVDSVAALQTADRARMFADGFELLGRDRNAVPRGCSLAAEEALGP